MKKNNVLIIEDDLALSIKMERHLIRWGYQLIGIYSRGEKALEKIKKVIPDVILLDINLSGRLNGLDVAKKIVSLNIPIVFMTVNKSETLFDTAKKVKSISYLIKPFDMLTLKGALEMARFSKPIQENKIKLNPTIFLKRGQQTFPVELNSILWLEADRNYCHIFSNVHGRFLIRKSMVKFINELPPNKIVKIHRQYAANINKVESVHLIKNELILKDDEKKLPIGRAYKESLITALKKREEE